MSKYFDSQYNKFHKFLTRAKDIFSANAIYHSTSQKLLQEISRLIYTDPDYARLNRNWKERLHGHIDELYSQQWNKVCWVLCWRGEWFAPFISRPDGVQYSEVYGGHHVWLENGKPLFDKPFNEPDELK